MAQELHRGGAPGAAGARCLPDGPPPPSVANSRGHHRHVGWAAARGVATWRQKPYASVHHVLARKVRHEAGHS